AAEAAVMVTAVAAAAVVAKNVRLFIVTSLEVVWNLVNADQDSELPTAFVSKLGDFVRMLATVARTELAAEPLSTCYVADDTLATLDTATYPTRIVCSPTLGTPFNLSCEGPSEFIE
ncbi:MAG: hypothetical protein ACXU87_14335, partial [Xanthobacteraceae bacterium]